MHSFVFRFRDSLLALYLPPRSAEREAAGKAGSVGPEAAPQVEPAHGVLRPFVPAPRRLG